MRKTILAITILAAAVCATVAMAASDKDDVLAVVNRFVDAFNKGDAKTACDLCAVNVVIIDEIPPYVWQGAASCQAWLSDYDADAKKREITDGHVEIGKPKHVDVTGDRAYVVIPSNYTYKMKGKPVKQAGSMFTLTLRKDSAGWSITGWSWATN